MKKFYFSSKKWMALVLIAVLPFLGAAQQGSAGTQGTITNDQNEPVPGATITVTDSIRQVVETAVTNSRGSFSLRNLKAGAVYTLVLSHVGFETRTITSFRYGGESVLDQNLQMTAANVAMNEVVVVGYGTQRKVNLTGAVDQVGSEYFEERPMPNITRGLQGVIPNLNIAMTDGKPTRGATFNVR
ncbi:MAG TPA: carboxypeptidase regulatory-like domain-containing protein, partial [Chitinophagaceae bacterium]|nr:carboxypeptidase regulatory-like domain-containing protein [Chitinophagaceae bacterium]